MTDLLTDIGDVAIRASVLVAAVAAALRLHRGSAATRHYVWTLALASLLLLPALSLALPRWEIPVLPAADDEPAPGVRQDMVRPAAEATEPAARVSAPLGNRYWGSTARRSFDMRSRSGISRARDCIDGPAGAAA